MCIRDRGDMSLTTAPIEPKKINLLLFFQWSFKKSIGEDSTKPWIFFSKERDEPLDIKIWSTCLLACNLSSKGKALKENPNAILFGVFTNVFSRTRDTIIFWFIYIR